MHAQIEQGRGESYGVYGAEGGSWVVVDIWSRTVSSGLRRGVATRAGCGGTLGGDLTCVVGVSTVLFYS